MIQSRYELNMDALSDMLSDYLHRDIPVLLYIAPIRQDKPKPYNLTEYNRWKDDILIISKKYKAHLVNLEKLVPGNIWGSYTAEDIDFMHFQGPGHRLLADALLPHVKAILKNKER
jgi:lysophospholipase L1-like esterase